MHNHHVGLSLFATFFVHLPFGIYGARFARFTKPWGRCLYVPILLTIALRRYLLIGYTFIPYFVAVALSAQVLGKRIGRLSLKNSAPETDGV